MNSWLLLISGMLIIIILLRLQMDNKDSYVFHGKVFSINSPASLLTSLSGLGFSPSDEARTYLLL